MRICKLISLALLLLLLLQPLYAAKPREAKRVLVLYSENKGHPAHELTDQGIREAFGSNELFRVRLYTEYLDVARFGALSHARTTADYLRRKYYGRKIHAIIAVYPYAVDFLLAERSTLFPGVPIIAAETTRSQAEDLQRSSARGFVTGTIVGDNIAGIIDDALRMRPKTRHIALVAGTAPNDLASEEIFRRGLRPYAGKVDLIDLTRLSMAETLARVGSLSPDTVVFYSSVFRDGAGERFVPREALLLIGRAATVPMFGLWESYLGFGIVGGRLASWVEHGREAAALALRVMGGESPASVPFGGEQAYVTAYDWRELKRWKIPEAVVPPGAEIRYRTPSFWEGHRDAVIGVTAFIMVETGLIVGLLVNFWRRRKVERSLRESEERVRLAASAAGAGLWSLQVDTGRIWATDRTLELFGLATGEELTLEKVLHSIHPEDRERISQTRQQALQSEQEINLEFRVILPDGNVRWIASRGGVRRDLPGGPNRVVGVSADITERKQYESELRTLTGRLISNQEEELRRLSRELHDDLTQRLAVLAIDAGTLEHALKRLQPETSHQLGDLKTRLIEASDETHDLSRRLHPSILEDLGVVQAIESECDTVSRRTGIPVSFEPNGMPASLPRDIALCLYRVLQEGLQNIAKHSKACEARVVLQNLSDGLRLQIQDSGIGFDVNRVAGGGIGLSSMRERAKLANGTVSVISEPGKGTEIQLFIPVGDTHAQAAHTDR
jgi:PAS domain S-box-containing protein